MAFAIISSFLSMAYLILYSIDENQQASLKDPLHVPIGPITRARSKMIKEALSGLIFPCGVQTIYLRFMIPL